MVIEDDEKRPVKERGVIAGDARAKAKAKEMVKLIKNPVFWGALSVYVAIRMFVMIAYLTFGCTLGWNDILNLLLLRRTFFKQHIAA